MDLKFTVNFTSVRRIACAMLAALLVAAGLPLYHNSGIVSADQVSRRSIQLSDASPSGSSTLTSGIGSGTNVIYRVTFTNVHSAGSMVIDFCAEDPIIDDTCTSPTGMSAPSAVSLPATSAGTVGGTGWTLDTSGTGQAKLKDDGVSAHDAHAGATQMFDLTYPTNPNHAGTFYARIYTYADNNYGAGSYSNATAVGNYVDYGGIALSITSVITITARVQESLTFCVTKQAPGGWGTHDCSDPKVTYDTSTGKSTLPALVLGHAQAGGQVVLDANTIDTGDIYSQLSTNATNGAVINLHISNKCGGLSANNPTNDPTNTTTVTCAIPPINSGSGAGPTAITAGTAAFGMIVFPGIADPGTTGATGTTTPTTAYYTAAHDTEPATLAASVSTAPQDNVASAETGDYFGMDNTTALTATASPSSSFNGAVTSTYGSTLATSAGPVYHVDNHYAFGATAALTTPAGIYTANMSMIATGTF